MIGLVVAAQIAITAYAPDTVSACDAVELTVAISRRGTSVPALVTPALHPFDLLRRSTSSRLDPGGGNSPLAIAEHRFVITTDHVGHIILPPFVARLGGETAQSRPLSIVVTQPRSRSAPSVVARARIDTSADLTLTANEAPDTVFVGQQATYEVAVFLNRAARDRLRRNPTFYPPEMQAMLAYELPPPSPAEKERSGTSCFDALVYRRALFPLVAGRLVIPPAQLVYSTGLSSTSLFSREESHELQTDSVMVVAIDPPSAGRPTEFSGTVGVVRVDAQLDSVGSRVGDPMLLTMRVTGKGNVKLFPRPAVRVPWGALVPADERVAVDSSGSRIGGSKEFDWVLTPRIAGEFDVPPVRYGYFDPSSRSYGVATAASRHVRVAPGLLASSDTGHVEQALAIRTRYTGPVWPPIQSRPLFWAFVALAPLPALAGRARRRVRERKATSPPNPMRLLAIRPEEHPVALRRQFVRALAQRLGCSPEDFTHPGALDRALRRAGVSRQTSSEAEALLRSLDAAAYAGDQSALRDAAAKASAIASAVDEEALARSELPFWVPLVLICIALGFAADAIAKDLAQAEFRRGVSAYMRQDYGTARDAFASATTMAPDSPDAWVNFGTTSWLAADTARAVFAWRQTLALEPAATDARNNLDGVREIGPSAPGWTPPLPRSASVWLFATLWFAGWGIAWASRRPRWQAFARLSPPLVSCALLIGVLAIEIESRVAGNRLAVVQAGTSLSVDPAIGMERGPAVATGEIVRIVGRRGTWVRVEASDDRDGWLPSNEVFLVSERRPPLN